MSDVIEKRIELNAPVSRVWRALTDHREFGEWFRVKIDDPFMPGQVSRGHITYPGYEHLRWEVTAGASDVGRVPAGAETQRHGARAQGIRLRCDPATPALRRLPDERARLDRADEEHRTPCLPPQLRVVSPNGAAPRYLLP